MMNRLSGKFIILILLSLVLLPGGTGQAQESLPPGPVYIVQEGDSLWDIAYRFHVSQEELANINGISNFDQISIGQQLVIPGLEGLQGVLTTQSVAFGESLHSLSLRYRITESILKRLNHITSPNELYAGYSLIVTQDDIRSTPGKRVTLRTGQTLLELAVLNDLEAWSLMAANNTQSGWSILPGDVIRMPAGADDGPGALPPSITSVRASGLTQGATAELLISGEADLLLSGSLFDHRLNFFPANDSGYFALQGVHAMAEPRLYPLALKITTPDGEQFDYSQMVMVRAGSFVFDRSLPVDPATLDPETNRAENELWAKSASEVTPEMMWSGSLYLPVEPVFAECYSSRFGSRRSYNGSEYLYFHTGLDFCGQVGDPIYAAAPGVVVFSGPLTVRGEATMIDHGLGVFTAYMHQSEILVSVGDRVEEGQLIGKVGNTGRVEGPHLHFEVLVGGIQVDPLEWLNSEFPSQ